LWIMNRREVWVKGEAGAKAYLEAKGYHILCTNFTTKVGEIDIIARDGDVTVFVEVKARTKADFGEPIEAVTPQKVRKITLVAKQYLVMKGLLTAPVRFDVVECIGGDFRHTENAFTLNDAAKFLRY